MYLSFIIEDIMDVKQIIEDACTETNTSLKEYWEEKALLDFNKIYRRVWRSVVRTHEDYFRNYWTTDIQEWVTEYAIQRKEQEVPETRIEEDENWEEIEVETWNMIKVPWISKVKKVSILFWEHYKEIPQLTDLQERTGYKGWILRDNHVILTWTPEEDIEEWIKLEWIQSVNDLDWESTEEDIFPWHEDLSDFSDVLALGLKVKLWGAKQDFEKKATANEDYEIALEDMRRFVAERVQTVYYTNLQYDHVSR